MQQPPPLGVLLYVALWYLKRIPEPPCTVREANFAVGFFHIDATQFGWAFVSPTPESFTAYAWRGLPKVEPPPLPS